MKTKSLIFLLMTVFLSPGEPLLAEEESVLLRYREEREKESVLMEQNEIKIEGKYTEEERREHKLEHLDRFYENMARERDKTEAKGKKVGEDDDGGNPLIKWFEEFEEYLEAKKGPESQRGRNRSELQYDPNARYKRELERKFYDI